MNNIVLYQPEIPQNTGNIGKAYRRHDEIGTPLCLTVDFETIEQQPTTPPSILIENNWRVFENNASDRKIYVPQESVEAYKNADGWSNYADAIVGYDF